MTAALARIVPADALGLAIRRLALPAAARQKLEGALPHLIVLLTGLTGPEVQWLLSSEGACAGLDARLAGEAQRRPGSALVAGGRAQLGRAAEEVPQGMPALAGALRAALASLDPPRELRVGARAFALGERTYVMGVVNVTPDSFSDGGQFFDPGRAIAHGEALAQAGADLLDVGGESTRPGAAQVDAGEELRRVLPVIRGLRARTQVPISIDTNKAEVAQAAIAEGASLVNDVSGMHFDPQMPGTVAREGASCCLMHLRGTPRTMQQSPAYADLVEEVIAFLREGTDRALAAGVARDRILVDPGIGFGKTAGHNLLLLRRLGDLRVLGFPILVGTSRKAFLGALTGGKKAQERLAATLGSVAAVAASGSADLVRVHDVAEAKDACAVADAIRRAEEAGDAFGPVS